MGMCCKLPTEKTVSRGLRRGACLPLPVPVLMSTSLICIVRTLDEPGSDL